MIRVAFLLSGDPGAWLGGLNYFRSLLGAIETLEDRRIEPLLLTDRRHGEAWGRHFPGIPRVATGLLDRWTPAWGLRKALQVLSGRDLLLQHRLWRLGVDCLSHSLPLGQAPGLRTMGWIPDFQHLHLPAFFTPEELRRRDKAFRAICLQCDRVLVSSEAAGRDLAAFCPEAADRVRILHFVPRVPPLADLPPLEVLQQTYGFEGPYFHLPNQFWAHKNHGLVIEALSLLRQTGRPALVLATGLAQDYRNPGYFEQLMARAREAGVDRDLRVLGVVPYLDMLGLMRHAVALLNPSRFEGWSTTVEEARRLGVPTLLSDLPVHREQNPPGARYFSPDDPEALAHHLRDRLASGPGGVNAAAETTYRQFGADYQGLVLELAGEGRKGNDRAFIQPRRKHVAPK